VGARRTEGEVPKLEDGGREKSAAATEAADYAEGQSSVRGQTVCSNQCLKYKTHFMFGQRYR
jgi:hypothetical protein